MRWWRRDLGFSLLEVLVALVIASLALAVLFSGALTGLRSARLSEHYQQATWRARSHLQAMGVAGPLVAGAQSGNDGSGFFWATQVSPVASAKRAVLFAVTVTISWSMDGGTRQVTLASERIGQAAKAPP